MSEHTKLPLKAVRDGTAFVIYSDDFDIIGVVDTDSSHDKERAELIVRAVNAHDKLLAACKALYSRIERRHAEHLIVCKLGKGCPEAKELRFAEAVIEKAKESQ